jgi:hypothetical protein
VRAREILAEFTRRGIRLTAKRGQIFARPKGATPPELREQVIHYKPELLRLLTWDPDAAASALRDTLKRIERAAAAEPAQIRDRIAELLALHGPIVAGLFVALDLDTLRYALRNLERSLRDAVAGRGYDNELAAAPCPVCSGACRWCDTPGVLLCGACYPRRKPRR